MEINRLIKPEEPEISYEHSLDAWRSGRIPSYRFFPVALGQFYKKHLYGPQRADAVSLASINADEIAQSLEASKEFHESYQLGLGGNNPPLNMVQNRYYNDIPNFYDVCTALRFRHTGRVNPLSDSIFEVDRMDSKLSTSLTFRVHLRTLSGEKDKGPFALMATYRKAVYKAFTNSEADKKAALEVLTWLHKESYLSSIGKMKVQVIERLNQDEAGTFNNERLFDSESLAKRFSTIGYFNGLEDKYRPIVAMARNTLPKPFQSKEVRHVVLDAFFLKNTPNRISILTQIIESIRSTGKADQAKRILAQHYVKHKLQNINLPLEQWQIDQINLAHVIAEVLEEEMDQSHETLEVNNDDYKNVEIIEPEEVSISTYPQVEDKYKKEEVGETFTAPPNPVVSTYPNMDKKYAREKVYPEIWSSSEFTKYLQKGHVLQSIEAPTLIRLPDNIQSSFENIRKSIATITPESYVVGTGSKNDVIIAKNNIRFESERARFDSAHGIHKELGIINTCMPLIPTAILHIPFFGERKFGIPHPNVFDTSLIYSFLTSNSILSGFATEEFNYLLIKTDLTRNPLKDEGLSLFDFSRKWDLDLRNGDAALINLNRREFLREMNAILEDRYKFVIYRGEPNSYFKLLNSGITT